MKGKFFLYIIDTILVIWSMDSLNIKKKKKKNSNYKAKLLYFFIGISIIYLITNFFMDLFTSIKIF